MNDSYNKQSFEVEDEITEFDFTDRLVEDAREFFSTEFENPPSEVCPHKVVLKQLLLSAKLPDEKQRAHLFSCSECFKEYHNALSMRKKISSVPSPPFWRNFFSLLKQNRVHLALGASLVLFILIGSFFLFRRYGSSDSQSVTIANSQTEEKTKSELPQKDRDNDKSENASVGEKKPSNENANEQSSPETAERSPSKTKGDLLAQATVTLDLNNKAVVRGQGTENEEQVVFRLLPKPTRLVLRLPENSLKGNYKVSLVDAFGNELMSRKAFSKNGKTLIINFDFRTFESKKYMLCVAHNEAIPECFLVAFENKQ